MKLKTSSQSLLIQRSYSYLFLTFSISFMIGWSQSLLIQRSYSYGRKCQILTLPDFILSQSLLIQRSYSYVIGLMGITWDDLVAIPSYSEVLFLLWTSRVVAMKQWSASQSLLIQRSYSYLGEEGYLTDEESQSLLIQRSYSYKEIKMEYEDFLKMSQSLLIQRSYSYKFVISGTLKK